MKPSFCSLKVVAAEFGLWRGRKRRAQEAGAAFQCLLPGQISSRLVPGAHTRTHTHTQAHAYQHGSIHKAVLPCAFTQTQLLTKAHKRRTHAGTQPSMDSAEDTWG